MRMIAPFFSGDTMNEAKKKVASQLKGYARRVLPAAVKSKYQGDEGQPGGEHRQLRRQAIDRSDCDVSRRRHGVGQGYTVAKVLRSHRQFGIGIALTGGTAGPRRRRDGFPVRQTQCCFFATFVAPIIDGFDGPH